jgi:CHAT domain-containing protein
LTQARSGPRLDELTRSINSFEPDGAPVELPRLAHTRQEAKEINALVPPGQRWVALDFAATRQSAMNPELSQYRILHFATHGLLNSNRPELSGLVFSLIDEHGRRRTAF